MNGDPYADLSHLCGITAFSLPSLPLPLPLPGPRSSADRHTTDLFGPIPDHLLSRYLCYDDPSSERHSFSSIPYSPSATTIHPSPRPLFLKSPSPCPNFTPRDLPLPPPDFIAPPSSESLLICDRDSPASGPRHMDSLVHEREILPPCVVNYQDSLYLSLEQESCSYTAALGVGDLDYENRVANLLPCEINEMPLCNPNDVLAEGNGRRLLSHIKKLALWHKDVILDDEECENMVSFMISFSDFTFSRHGRRNSLQETSRKKPRKDVSKSHGVATSSHFTRSKSANRLSAPT